MIKRLLLVAVLGACGSSDDSRHIMDACVASGSNSVSVTGPATYACHDMFMTKVTYTNNSCDPVNVTGVSIHGEITSGSNCTPSADYTYPVSMIVQPGETATVLNLTNGNPYCCTAPGPCPTPYQCDEDYTLTVNTGLATQMLSGSESVHLSLDGCTVTCS
ncbi:MAG: hypothetical protein QM831_27930 [Kofleriaceae bacterium]